MKIKIRNKILSLAIFSAISFFPAKIFAQWKVDDLKQFNLPDSSVFGIVSNLVVWLLGTLEVICFIAFIISGLMYLTAAGDEARAGNAKKAMTYSIIGVIVGFSGFVFFKAAQALLNATAKF
ncbi:MAG TPA: hypothetical protein P5232_01885 [Candidatus Moranbacteria bacterium]|nr:hypothetical protein [Candidatus Moranbacteria bacterium]